uniref:HEAT repeat-containing protein 1 n=1 Tax=Meloidogyne hapla TaxID=6305 RepID=A0A1I8BYQ3_MELHA
MGSYSERLDQSLNILENYSFGAKYDSKLQSTLSTKSRRTPSISFERERQACSELSILLTNLDSLGAVGNQQINREKLSRAIAVLFQFLNHPEQCLRFLADQILDEIFRKFVLKFQAPKVIAYLLTELDKKKPPARLICSVLQKLSWVAVYTRAQRAEVYNAHFLCGMIQCIQNQDDSVQQAIQRYFPAILDHFGPFISAAHTERATELFNAAMNNLTSSGVKNRAASTVINILAKFVPSILHKSFYQLAEIILNAGDNDEQHQHELAGALNTLSLILPLILENLNQSLALMLKKLLCRVLCCLYSPINEVVLASLEFLQKLASRHQQFETMSCFSIRTGCSSSRPTSAWNSLQDLLAEQQMLGLNLDEQIDDDGEQTSETIGDAEENYHKTDKNILEYDDNDNISVSSAEIFVDPLMNCLHQQQKSDLISNSSWSLCQKSKNLKSNDGTISMRTRTNTTSGLLTPISIVSRSAGQKSFEDQQCSNSAISSEETQGILEFLPDSFCNTGVNFWIYSALFVARKFLLAGKGRIRSNREIRTSYKILALNYIADSLIMESSLIQQPIFDSDGQHYYLTDLHLYIGNDDDNLAIAALNFFFNVEKCCFFNDPSQYDKIFVEKSKLIWYLKKTLHCQRNSNRLKGIFQIFINSIPLLCATDSLLLTACEYAIIADADVDYFRVKAVKAKFLSKIKWSYTSTQIRQKLQTECSKIFIGQLFDKDPRVQKATLDVLPLFVLNIDLGQNANISTSFSLPHCLESHSSLPVIIGLSDNQHSFFQTKTCDDNFSFIFNKIYSLTMDQFFEQKSGFIFSLEVLINNFPLNYFSLINESQVTGMAKGKESRSLNISQKEEKPSIYSLFLLLLDFAENITCSLEEFSAIIRLMSKLFSAVSTYLINQNVTLNNTSNILQLWNLCQTNTENAQQPPKSKTPNNNCVERCLMLYLRILNLFYSIVAEEKVRRHKVLLHRTGLIAEGFVSNAAFLLSNPSSLILPEKSDYFSSAKSLSNTSSTSAKAINLSFLLGSTSHHHGRRQLTSYSNSTVLTSLEMQLRNSYKAFLMDISSENSASLVSHLIKSAFKINYFSLKPMYSNPLRQTKFWEEMTDCNNNACPLELLQSIQAFNTFIKFAHRSEFSSLLIEEMAGWMHSSRLKLPLVIIEDETQQEQMNKLLHQFEPFITRLLKLYPLTNSNRTRKSIFDCIFIICLCNVRYELLDVNGKFKSKVISQLKQLSPEEDAPILPSMFIFILLVVRVRCLKSSEIAVVLEGLFARMDHKVCYWVLETSKIIIFDVLSQFNRKSRITEEHKRILIQLKDGLSKVFSMTFQFFPEASAEVWICLLHAFKEHFDCESWSNTSLDFITHYLKFCQKMAINDGEFTTPQHSPTRETTPHIDASEQYSFLNGHSIISKIPQNNFCLNPIHQLFLHSALLCQCFASNNLSIIHLLFRLENFICCDVFLFYTSDGYSQTSQNYIFHSGSEATLMFLIFTIHQKIKSSKPSRLSVALKKHLCINYNSSVYVKLAHCSTSLWSFWMNLQFTVSNELSFRDFDALPSKCKSILVQLLFYKIFQFETESEVETLFISLLDSLKLPSSKADFLLEFLRTRDEKMFKKCLNKLPKNVLATLEMELIQVFCQNWGEDVFIPNNELSGLLPRLFSILAKSENQQIIALLTRINEIPESNSFQLLKVIWAYFSNKSEQTFTLPCFKFTSKDLSILHDKNVSITQFYKILILRSSMPDDFEQIIEGILTLSEEEIGDILDAQIPHWKRLNIDKRHWPVQIEIPTLDEKSSIVKYWQEEEREDLEEAIKKLFSLVQRIVFSLKNDLLECEEAKEAFQALLANVSLFHRMALVPESALILDWILSISVNKEGKCSIPLIQIHLLNDLTVLQDFCFRIFSFGWSSRSQFEEFSMSLFGVLSSTPTTLSELQQRTESDGINAVHQQLADSSLAVEALSCVLLQSLLYPKPGDLIDSFFVVIHRKRRENYLFLDTEPGKSTLKAKLHTNLLIDYQNLLNNTDLFIENLECVDSKQRKQYRLGQTALYHLWSVTGLLESSASSLPVEAPLSSSVFYTREEPETSANELSKLNDDYDTSSSLRALFDTFMHWLNSSGFISHLPLSILHSTLRSLSLLSDLFQEKGFYRQTFSTIKSLLANNPFLFNDPTCKGYSYYLLIKCSSVLDWTELADSGEVSTAKYIEGIINSGFLQQDVKFVQICSLHGLLYLLQSLALEHLHNLMSTSFDFVVKELKQIRQGINSMDCYIFYQKLCWAFAFGILQEAIPLCENSRDELLQLVKLMFIDPHLPDWLKSLLTHGIESLVLHSCSYASNFRLIALEYFDTYQLQPGHLPYALSIYFTCAYRELNEGGEYTYAFNKNFGDDFLKILNIFSFYSNSSLESKILSMCHLLSDLISFVWAKEVILECLWTVLMPPLTPIASPRKPLSFPASSQNDPGDLSSTDFSDPLQCPSKIYRKVCLELAANFFMPKLMNRRQDSTEMIRYLTLILLCSTANNEAESKR